MICLCSQFTLKSLQENSRQNNSKTNDNNWNLDLKQSTWSKWLVSLAISPSGSEILSVLFSYKLTIEMHSQEHISK